jgi:hypothetical protein
MTKPTMALLVRLRSALPEAEAIEILEQRADDFRALPGLIQKYYLQDPKTGDGEPPPGGARVDLVRLPAPVRGVLEPHRDRLLARSRRGDVRPAVAVEVSDLDVGGAIRAVPLITSLQPSRNRAGL